MSITQSKSLIFLVSQPRSGSTLLQLILSGHPDIATTSEPWIALHPLFALRSDGIDTVYDSGHARHALSDFLRQSGADEDFYKQQLAEFLLSLYSKSMAHQKKKMFLDKTPRYYHIVSDLMKLFPEAKFIILFRNPLAVLNSILKTWVKSDILSLGSHRDDLITAPRLLVDALKVHPEQCLRMQYEDLVADPEMVMRKTCRFLGITYTPAMLDYKARLSSEWNFGDPVGVFTSGQPEYRPAHSWEKDLASPQERSLALSYMEELGPELVHDMGYEYDVMRSSIKPPPKDEKGLVSWSTIMNEAGGLQRTKEIRKIITTVLRKKHESDDSDYREWEVIISNAVEKFMRLQVESTHKKNHITGSLFRKVTSPFKSKRGSSSRNKTKK